MLPVVRGAGATSRQVLLYTFVLVASSLAPGVLGTFGVPYLVAATLLDAVLCRLAWRLWCEQTTARASVLFHYTLLYLALLFIAVAVAATV